MKILDRVVSLKSNDENETAIGVRSFKMSYKRNEETSIQRHL